MLLSVGTIREAKIDEALITRALEQLRAAVKSRGLKASRTRESVARAALEREGHFSVDDLVSDLKANGETDAHATTVYRVLPFLVEAGLLQETLVSTRNGVRYERSFERQHHDHVICTQCGKVVEFESQAIEELQTEIAKRLGFDLTGHVHELLGLCETCRPARVPRANAPSPRKRVLRA
jgi:Fur family transcriptional regulator, ferric uptake regulator